MAELLVFALDLEPHPEPQIAAKQFQRGMVIAVHEDGHVWGKLDLGPHTHLVKLPGVAVEDVIHLVGAMNERGPVLGQAPTIPLLRVQRAKSLPLEPPAANVCLADWLEANFEILEPAPHANPRVIG